MKIKLSVLKGGTGSGNHGHSGRPGHVGGSAGGGHSSVMAKGLDNVSVAAGIVKDVPGSTSERDGLQLTRIKTPRENLTAVRNHLSKQGFTQTKGSYNTPDDGRAHFRDEWEKGAGSDKVTVEMIADTEFVTNRATGIMNVFVQNYDTPIEDMPRAY